MFIITFIIIINNNCVTFLFVCLVCVEIETPYKLHFLHFFPFLLTWLNEGGE